MLDFPQYAHAGTGRVNFSIVRNDLSCIGRGAGSGVRKFTFFGYDFPGVPLRAACVVQFLNGDVVLSFDSSGLLAGFTVCS